MTTETSNARGEVPESVEFWAARLEMLADLHGCGSATMRESARLLRELASAPPSAPVGVDLEQFREAVMFWKGWAAIGLAVEKIGPFTLRQEEDVYQQRVNEADRLLALIDRASPLQACDCPAGGKRDPKLHAPNCPARLAQQPAAVDEAMVMVQKHDALILANFATTHGGAMEQLAARRITSLATQHQEPTT